MIQLQQGAAYSDNRRDVSEAAFEAEAVAVAVWNMLRTKPEGFARCSTRSPPKPRAVPSIGRSRRRRRAIVWRAQRPC
jgi:hypothetical protein